MPDVRTVTLNMPTPASVGRGLLLVFVLLLPIIFDLSVPEVAGDIRWAWNHLFSGLLVAVGLGAWWASGKPLKVDFQQPVIFWWALLLAVWAAVSLIDAMHVDRGIVPIKAMYAQLLLIPAVYLVWKPGFTRKLAWVMALPLGYCAFVGFCQYFQWIDPSFKLLLSNTWSLAWLGALWPENGPINWIVTTYLQSAVPGSTFANKNLAGSYTVMMIPIAAYVAISSRAWWGKALGSLMLAMGVLFLVYSRARASWVALTLGLMVLGVALVVHPAWRDALLARARPMVLMAVLAPAVLAVTMFGGMPSPVQGAHGLDRSPAEQMGALATSSWDEIGGRMAYNLNSLAITKDHWFNGVGLGNFFNIYPAYHDAVIPTVKNSYNIMARPQRTHTDLMQAFTEIGIVGGVSYAAVLLSALWMAWQLGRAEAVARAGLFPLFAGLSLFVVSVNALMDFPMQLPTAPALACVLMGVLTANYLRVYPSHTWGWKMHFKFPRMAAPVLMAVWVAVMGVVLWDDYWFRKGNQILKVAMVRVYNNVNDDETLRLVKLAQETYPWDPRIQEHVGVVYANYKGTLNLSIEDKIDQMEWALARDPWGPNHLVNLSGQYLALAEANLNGGNVVAGQKQLARVEELFTRLKRVGGFSHYTWGIGAMLRVLQGNNVEALEFSQRALKLQPDYAPAANVAMVAAQRLGISLTAVKP